MSMRAWLLSLAALALCAGPAFAQSPLSCGAAPQGVCENQELAALESERAALVAQLTSLDAQNPAIANEQTWIDGLSACGEDAECYRTAYFNHNQTLRQSIAALPGAADAQTAPEAPAEEPAEAPTIEEETRVLDAAQEQRLREPREDSRQAYVATGMPGWGFFTAIGVSFFVFWMLMRALGRHRRELRAEEGRIRGWRR